MKTSKKITFSVWGKSAQRFSLGDESAMMKIDGVDTKPQAVGRRIERLTGFDVVAMRQDSQEQRGGEIVATTYEITLGRTLYRRGLDGKRQPDGSSVEGSLWCSIPRG